MRNEKQKLTFSFLSFRRDAVDVCSPKQPDLRLPMIEIGGIYIFFFIRYSSISKGIMTPLLPAVCGALRMPYFSSRRRMLQQAQVGHLQLHLHLKS